MRDWRDTQLFTTGAPSPPRLGKRVSPPRGGSAFSPLPTPTACKFGARPASPIQYGRRRILKNPFWSAQNRTGGSVYFCAQGTCLAPIHWTSGADRRRVARCGFMSRFGSLYCRSFTWCLALLISRQSLMCGGPRTSRAFSRNERHAESTRQVRYCVVDGCAPRRRPTFNSRPDNSSQSRQIVAMAVHHAKCPRSPIP